MNEIIWYDRKVNYKDWVKEISIPIPKRTSKRVRVKKLLRAMNETRLDMIRDYEKRHK